MLPMEWVLLLAGLAAGAVLAWMVAARRGPETDGALRARAETLAADLAERNRLLDAARERETAQRERIAGMEATAAQISQQMAELREAVDRARTEGEQSRRELGKAQVESAELRTALDKERSGAEEKIAVLQQAREELSNQFKALANEILEQKSKAFTEQNQANLTTLLTPLREKFGEFQLKVESLEKDGIAGRSELKTQIAGLRTLNERLSADANNLVTALKGSSKTQGDWGEFVLEKLLESAGLREGQEYRVQSSFTRDDRSRARPDVILDMPGSRHLVIDAKVSLSDYDEYCAAEEESARETALQHHIASMRAHIRDLAQRNYQALYGLNSLDFTVMFVPIEPAFMLALAHEGNLWQEAWDRNVLLVSRTTLLFVLRTVAQLWRQEQQTRNVQEIVRRGGELYDKLAAFAKDLTDVGKSLEAARQSYDDAYRKLAQGKGNAIRQAEMLKSLGVKPTKSLPLALVEQAMDEDQPLALAAVGDDGPQPE
ncbi:MAG: DNA recombination protein RmuC [Acidobacteriaceae bacterium]